MTSIVLFEVIFYQHEMFFFQTVDGGAESCLTILKKEAAHAGGSCLRGQADISDSPAFHKWVL